jgi:hypothetical protein
MTARAHVFVDRWPEQAFRVFVEEVGMGFDGVDWWWIRPERGRYLRFGRREREPVVEAYDALGARGLRIGGVLIWRPGARLGFDWREDGWPEAAGAGRPGHARMEVVALSRSGGRCSSANSPST